MEKKQKKNYNFKHQQSDELRLKSRIFSICNDVIKHNKDHEYMLERTKKEVWDTDVFKGLIEYRRWFLRGFFDAFISQINTMIVWKVYHPDLGLIIGDNVPDGEWSKIVYSKGKFVWKESGNAYSLSEEERIAKNGKENVN